MQFIEVVHRTMQTFHTTPQTQSFLVPEIGDLSPANPLATLHTRPSLGHSENNIAGYAECLSLIASVSLISAVKQRSRSHGACAEPFDVITFSLLSGNEISVMSRHTLFEWCATSS